MSNRQRPLLAHCAFASLFLALLLPNIALLWFKWTRLEPLGTGVLPLAIALNLAWFALFGRRLWLGCLLLAPLALAMPLELYYVLNYQVPSSVAVLGTMAATTSAETMQYISGNIVVLVLSCAAGLAVALAALRLVWRERLQLRGRTRLIMAGVALLLIAGLTAMDLLDGDLESHHAVRFPEAARIEADRMLLRMEKGYPFGIPLRLVHFLRYRQAMRARVAKLENFRFDAKLLTPLPKRQVYVLVIGESSRRDHWQIFGYDRPTNPELSKQRNLILIQRMVSAYTQTRFAVPVMITRKPVRWSAEKIWPETSIVRAMHEAGFRTWWISNQYALSPLDSAVSVYANEADKIKWLNHAKWDDRGGIDEDLVAPLQEALDSTDGNLFVVLHMLGSHDFYDYRYPSNKAYFTPTESDQDLTVPEWQKVVNSYDNTIRYTDEVLSKIIGVLQDSGAPSALWYASDHGETLPSPTCDERSHAHQNRPEYRIPALFWYSDEYAQAFPDRVDNLRANAGHKTMSQNIFPSLLDMAGVDVRGHKEREDWSLFNPKWQFHTRWVKQFWQVNYDDAKTDSGCGKLVPPEALEDSSVLPKGIGDSLGFSDFDVLLRSLTSSATSE